jgi:glutamine synthetase
MSVTLNEIKKLCEEKSVKMADFMMIDLNGRWRHLTMPIARLTEDTLKNGVGFDGSNYGFAPVEKSDMVFVPDLESARLDPFAEVVTLQMIGDVYVIDLPNNRRFDQDPRNVAIHAEEYLRSSGIADEMRIGPEFEFHVFDHVSYAVKPNTSRFKLDTAQAEWNTGLEDEENLGYKVPLKAGYHAAPPLDRLSGFRSRATMLMEEQGILVKYHLHEVGGPCELEIEV